MILSEGAVTVLKNQIDYHTACAFSSINIDIKEAKNIVESLQKLYGVLHACQSFMVVSDTSGKRSLAFKDIEDAIEACFV